MRVGAVVAIGPLDRFGYGHNLEPCARSMTGFAERVVFVQSTRHLGGVKELIGCGGQGTLLRNAATWFGLDGQGGEVFDVWRVEGNKRLGLEEARRQGLDAAVVMDINSYVPEGAADGLWHACRDMVTEGRAWGWLYRGNQVGNRLFHANKRLPRIINLHRLDEVAIVPDALETDGGTVRYEYGDYLAQDDQAVVDAELELTPEECEAKHNYMRCYQQVLPQRDAVFAWEWWWPYMAAKYRAKRVSDEPLGPTAQAVARNSRRGFLAWRMLTELGL